MRKRARRKAEGEEGAWIVDNALIEDTLGNPTYAVEEAEKEPEIGTVTGLAWTNTGGDLMVIEALRMPGTGRLIVTGQLGEVGRKESPTPSLGVTVGRIALLHRLSWNRQGDGHPHHPAEKGVPKDGPSAGAAVTLAIASA